MSTISRGIVIALAGALIAGCGGAPLRSGKGNDHELLHKPGEADHQVSAGDVQTVQAYDPPAAIHQLIPVSRTVTPTLRQHDSE